MNINYKRHFKECKRINSGLFEMYETGKIISFYDAYVFHITSNLISYICGVLNEKENNTMKFFCLRCILESIAVLKMYKDQSISKEETSLLIYSLYIKEFEIYNKYKDSFNGLLFDFSNHQKNHEIAIKKFKENNIKYVKVNPIPWCKEKKSFEKIINKYIPELLKEYKIFSAVIHPCDLYIKSDWVDGISINRVEEYIFNYMNTIYLKYRFKYIKKNEYDYMFDIYAKGDIFFREYIKNIIKIYDYKNLFIENDLTDYLLELIPSIFNIQIDYFFGMTEIIKSKFKSIIELVSIIDEINNKGIDVDLLKKYNEYQLLYAMGYDVDEEAKEIKKIAKVDTVSFKKIFGKWYSDIVEKYLDRSNIIDKIYNLLSKNIPDFFDEKKLANMEIIKEKEKIVDYFKMSYYEAEILSHGNGYLIYTNKSSFEDVLYIMLFLFIEVNDIIDKLFPNEINDKELEEAIMSLKKYPSNFLVYHLGKKLLMKISPKQY